MHQGSDTLWMLGVREALEKAVRGAEDGKSHFRPIDDGGETFVMAFAGFAEEHGLNAAPGAQRFFNEPDAFDAYEATFRGQSAAESHAKLLEPAIVAAGEDRGLSSEPSVTSGFARRGHHRGA
jgi:hypothetical protein